MLHILNATYEDNYRISIEFSDHKKGTVDLKDFIFNGKIKPFKELMDINRFKQFTVDYTIRWNDNLDLAPEYLYFKTFENDIHLRNKFKEWGYL